MRRLATRTLILVSAGVLAAGLLASCAATPVPRATFSPTADAAAPLFATDEEALAAAEAAYAAYLEVSNQIARDGGVGLEELKPFLSPETFVQESAALEGFKAKGWIGRGGVDFDSFELQQRTTVGGTDTLVIYACLDASGARLVDGDGNDVTPAERRDRTPIEMTMVIDPAAPSLMRIDSSKVWSGADFC